MLRLRVALLTTLFCFAPDAVRAQAAPDPIPPALSPWVDWVKAELGEAACPRTAQGYVCVWPGALSLTAHAQGAEFTLSVWLSRAGRVRLPGSRRHWPEAVRSGKQPLVVLEHAGAPYVRLEAGDHRLSGALGWSALPDALDVGADVGTVQLVVNGDRVSAPRREDGGLLWLGQRGVSHEEERLELSVHRRLDDGVPLRVTTRLNVSAAGTTREVLLRDVLLPETLAIELRSALPVELTAEGSLRLQVQPGEHQVEVVAIMPLPSETLRRPQSPAPWPDQELWVWQADDRLRHAELSGPAQVDPARTDLAADWTGLPTYIVKRDSVLKVDTRRRGEAEPPPNQVTLQRSLWLDLDGQGYTLRDQLRGTLRRDFRLSLTAGELGHVVDHGDDQVITLHGELPGVELRERDMRLSAEWRLPQARSDLPAVGYDMDVDHLSAELNLPPGYMLIGTDGVDRVDGTWLDGWNLFDFFFVLLVALAVGRIAGLGAGAVALLTLVLTHHMHHAPQAAWVALLIFTALVRSVGPGRFRRFAQIGWIASLVCLLFVALPFAVSEVRAALYPHLGPDAASNLVLPLSHSREAAPAVQSKPMEAPAEDMEQDLSSAKLATEPLLQGARAGAGSLGYTDAPARRRKRESDGAYGSRRAPEPDPSSVVQTGPGLPNWTFSRFSLQWSGPVAQGQELSLWLAPPWVTRLWSVAAVLLSALLLFLLARAARKAKNRPSEGLGGPGAAAGLLLALLGPGQAKADDLSFPPERLLNELKERVSKAPDCAPDCLAVGKLRLDLNASELSVRAEVHAGATAAYRVPGPVSSWAPTSLRVDGKESFAMARLEDGFLHVLVEPGLHVLTLSGPVPRGQSFTLSLGSPPHHVEANHEGFVVEGLHDDGRAEGSLSIRREIALEQTEQASSSGVGQWLEVRRELSLGVRFRATTTVRRLSPANESVLVRIPLLPGEEPTDEKLLVEGGEALVELARGQSERAIASFLPPTETLTLKAQVPPTAAGEGSHPFSEVWVVRPSQLYRVDFEGIAPVRHLNEEGTYQPWYRPWPTETLTIHAKRLAAAKGASTTVDSVEATYTPGTRIEKVELTAQVRTSRGTSGRISLPEGAVLSDVSVDGVQTPARVKGGELELHLDPGAHRVDVVLSRNKQMGLRYQPLALALDTALTNVTSVIRLPEGRWLLWTRGPPWGAAVLFWGYLLVALLGAMALGRIGLSPLKTYEWCLLSLGLTQVEAPAVLLIVGWLFALALRERHTLAPRALFNAAQVGLVLWTLVAVSCLAGAVHQGLVVRPDMQVQGMDSHNGMLRFYTDRTQGDLPTLTVWSAPLWIYKALMLLWALWLASSLIRWLRWGFAAFRKGDSWRTAPRNPTPKPSRENPRAPVEQAAELEAKLREKPKSPPEPDET